MRVALLLSTNLASNRDVLRGIKNYCRAAPGTGRGSGSERPWSFLIAWPQLTPLNVIARWKPDGIIAKLYTHDMIGAFRRMRIPLVNITNIARDLSTPRVAVDEGAVGRLAAEHFLERGFRNFAYIGYRQQRGSAGALSRMNYFQAALKAAGRTCSVFTDLDLPTQRPGGTWGTSGVDDRRLSAWLKQLPKPAAIFCYHDFLAWEILEVCHALRIAVPEEAALLGADDDELFCDLSQPPLSSIAYPAERIGFHAAALLDGLMRGKRAPRKPVLIAPVGVVTRQSSDIVAIDDPHLAQAVRFIRAHACQPLAVKTLLAQAQVSRRTLEQKFRRALGRTPHEEIVRVRIGHARQLLSRTDLSMPEIAARAGFSNAERLSVVFKEQTGVSPTVYRRTTK
jgi:LacI family transcriptional regulator